MKVTEYFVGFGPRLWSFRRGETEYGVKAIPAGGYVKITGFTVLEEVAEEDEPRTYRQQAFWKRIVVASAGSAMHFVIALVLAVIVVFTWGVPSNNQKIEKFDHWIGVAQTPAQQAGFKAGDIVVSFNGHGFSSPSSLQNDLKRSADRTITLGVERGGQLLNISVTPRSGQGLRDSTGPLGNRPYIGVQLNSANTSVNPIQAVGHAAANVGSYTQQEVIGVVHVFSPSGLSSFFHQVTNSKAAAKASSNLSTDTRPISLVGIASLGVQSQQQGLFSLLQLLILVNIVFGLMNMLPILPLDGGHVAIAAYEWIRTKKGKPFYRADITKMFPFVAVILAFLAVIVISAIYLDIAHPIQLPH
jgi:membrane-associated protease RseP (regulator of RpoE activity)